MDAHRFLIIEDDEMAQMAMNRLLAATSVKIDSELAVNGREALDVLHAKLLGDGELPSAIVMDLMMPEMTGFEFLEAFEELSEQFESLKEVPVFVVSAANAHEDVARCKRFDCVRAFVSKYPNALTISNLIKRHCQPLSSGA